MAKQTTRAGPHRGSNSKALLLRLLRGLLHVGLELARCYRGFEIYGRLAFEMQNWHSDVLANEPDINSLGFVGPGIRAGAEF